MTPTSPIGLTTSQSQTMRRRPGQPSGRVNPPGKVRVGVFTLLRLAMAAARYRLSLTALLIVLGTALTASVVGFRAVDDSSSAAIAESVRGDFGHRAYALQSSDPSVARILASRSDAAPVTDEGSTLTASGLSIDVLVRSTTDPRLQLGVLAAGRRPAAPGEALVSNVVADSLRIHPGDQVSLGAGTGSTTTKVTGIMRDPANVSAQWVFQVVANNPRFHPTRWLMDTNLANDRSLGPLLSRTSSRIASVESAVPLALENKPPTLTALGFFPAGAGLLLGCLITGAVVALARRWRKDAAALQASCLSPRAAWFVFAGWVASGVVLGELAGSVASVAALSASRKAVSGWLGQDWGHVSIPAGSAVAVVVVTAALALIAIPTAAHLAWLRTGQPGRGITTSVPPRWVSRRGHGQRPSRLILLAVLAAATVAWGYLALVSTRDASQVLALLLGCVLAAGCPYVVSSLVASGLPRATKAMFGALVGGLRLAAAAAGIVIFLAGAWSAQSYYSADQGEAADNPEQPKSSLVVADAPSSSVDLIHALYRKYGGGQLIDYQMAAESGSHILRVTSSGLVACVNKTHATSPDDLEPQCWPDSSKTATPINAVALGPAGSATVADPGLVQDGTVGLLVLTPRSRNPIADTATVHADADARLGGVLPGLVVPLDSPVVADYQLTPSGVSQLLLTDYGKLSPSDRLRLRAEIARIAPTALLNDSTAPSSYDLARSQAGTAGVFGAVAAVLLLLLGGYATVQTTASARRLVQDLGTLPGLRWSLVLRWLAVPVASALLAGALAYLTVSWGGRAHEFPYGPWWASPAAAALLAAIVLGGWFVRPSRSDQDAE